MGSLLFRCSKKYMKLGWGGFNLLLSLALLIYMRVTPWATKTYKSLINSPTLFPYIGIYGLMALSLILIISAILEIKKSKDIPEEEKDYVTINLYGIILAAIWGIFILLNNVIGFLAASFLCLLASLWLCKVKMRSFTPYVVAIAVPLFFYFVFGKLLKVRFAPFPFL